MNILSILRQSMNPIVQAGRKKSVVDGKNRKQKKGSIKQAKDASWRFKKRGLPKTLRSERDQIFKQFL